MGKFLLWAHKAPIVILFCLTKLGPTWVGYVADRLSKLRERAAQSEGSKGRGATQVSCRSLSFHESVTQESEAAS
jgi:hypothetical protein